MKKVSKKKIELLKKVSLFSTLDDPAILEIEKHIIARKFSKGDTIFDEGSLGQELYIVEKGQVLISKKIASGNEQILASYIDGDFFNEMNFFEDIPKLASAHAEDQTQLLIFPYSGLIAIMNETPHIAARILHQVLVVIASRNRVANQFLAEKTQQTREVQKQEVTDKLTGQYNRSYLDRQLEDDLSGMGDWISVVVYKPDKFKQINDQYGHVVGDYVLKRMAEILEATVVGEKDKIIRYRGNEFIIILAHTEKYAALKVAESLRTNVGKMDISDFTEGKKIKITSSIGVASYPDNGENVREVINRGYQIMQEVMTSGGNQVEYI